MLWTCLTWTDGRSGLGGQSRRGPDVEAGGDEARRWDGGGAREKGSGEFGRDGLREDRRGEHGEVGHSAESAGGVGVVVTLRMLVQEVGSADEEDEKDAEPCDRGPEGRRGFGAGWAGLHHGMTVECKTFAERGLC